MSQINWNASPASLFTNAGGTGSGFNRAWTGTSEGKGTNTATLVHPYGSCYISTTLWVGLPDKPLEIFCPTGNPLCRCSQYNYQYGVNGTTDGAESFYWDLQLPGIILDGNTGSMVNFYYPSSTTPGDYSIVVKSVNGCGSSSYLIEELEVQDCSKELLSFNLYEFCENVKNNSNFACFDLHPYAPIAGTSSSRPCAFAVKRIIVVTSRDS